MLLLIALGLLSFTPTDTTGIKENVIRFFDTLQATPQAKLYLHLDKPYYTASDSMWFKGYLVNASNHLADMPDNFMYVEILDQKDSVLTRRKFNKMNNIFSGNIQIPPNTPTGEYLLRAYTNWMRNAGKEYFYAKKITIDNDINNIKSTVEYLPNNENIQAKVHFSSNLGTSFDKTNVVYGLFDKNGKNLTSKTLICDENGEINIFFDKKTVTLGAYIRVDFTLSKQKYGRDFFLPDFSDEFDITFFPEGGNLLTGINQLVAFKCQQADGYSKEVSGVIVNPQGDTLTSFQTEHDGMGIVYITPIPGEQLIARVNGSDKTFALPKAQAEGLSLCIVQEGNKLSYKVKSTPQTVWPDTLILLGHTRGFPLLLTNLEKKDSTGIINIHTFGDGISHLLLVDKQGAPISQRLIFKYPDKRYEWSVKTDKDKYAEREKVSMEVLLNIDDMPNESNFSISITDDKSVVQDTLAGNIISNLLLTSDLKGYIHNPGYYFMEKDKKRLDALDLLMLTHGWTRFSTDNIMQVQQKKPEFFVEKDQFISGKIGNIFGKKAKEAHVFILAPQHQIIRDTQADENGVFILDGLDYTDTTLFIVRANTRKGSSFASLEIDREFWPEKDTVIPFLNKKQDISNSKLLFNIDKNSHYKDGIRNTLLKEVVVVGQEEKEPEFSVPASELERTKYRTIYDYAKVKLAQVLQDHPRPIDPISKGRLLVIIDRRRFDSGDQRNGNNDDNGNDNMDILRTIDTDEVASFKIYRDQTETEFVDDINYFDSNSFPAIVIELKPEARKRIARPNISWYESLGYTPAVEFYSPTYNTPKKEDDDPDLRTTIYWNPCLKFNKEGKASIEFYTSDSPSSYNVEIEGVSKKGIVCRYQGNILKE